MARRTEPLYAITHCHTRQSRNRASPMDAYIRAAVERVTGEPADAFDWSESLTSAADLERLLDGGEAARGLRRPAERVDLLFVTDHVNETTRALDADLVALAVGDPRVALGAEVQTVAEDPPGSGRFVAAPELLLYGGPDRVRSPGGWHFGVSAEILADLHRRCAPEAGGKPELQRLLGHCRERGIAHALAHPLDGHQLGLAATLLALSSCQFLETVNGGFSGDSTRRLLRYCRLHNAVAAQPEGARARPASGARGRPAHASDGDHELARWLVERLAAAGRDGIAAAVVPWGGSDAHLGAYARVRVAFRPRNGTRGAGIPELLSEMLGTPPAELLADQVFRIVGRGGGLGSCLAEVGRLLAHNARRNRRTFAGLRRTSRLALIGPYLALRKVVAHRLDKERLARRLDEVLGAAEWRAVGAWSSAERASSAQPYPACPEPPHR